MPSPHERRRNNIKAGIFVSISILLGVIVILALTEATEVFDARTSYVVRYPVSTGVSNLQEGAEVRVGGVPLGRVTEVRPVNDDDGAFTRVDVAFDLSHDVRLFRDAKIFVTTALLGDGAWIDITSVGDPALVVGDDDVIDGAPAVGMLNALLGPENAAHTTAILEHAEVVAEDAREMSGFLASLPQEYDDRVAPMLDDARHVVGEFRTDQWPRWSGQVDGLLAWSEGLARDVTGVVANADGGIDDVREVVAANRGPLANSVTNAERAMENAEAVTARFRAETLDRFHAVLEEGERGVTTLAAAIDQVRTDYSRWSVDVDGTLANVRTGSAELRMALTEIRRSPWKAFHNPGRGEFEHELLYESARSFLLATADLRAAADATERVIQQHGERLAADGELADLVSRNLVEPLQKYEAAQQRLLDVIATDGP